MWQQLLHSIQQLDRRALARAISLVENEAEGYYEFLKDLPVNNSFVAGITGPPGAGKSTLLNALLGRLLHKDLKIAVLCVDPSSPFHLGALLGDRIRMNAWYNHPNVYIRSLASRGSLGGLHPKIIEITDLLKAFFDIVIIETVGVGQSEIEVAGLADKTVLVLVPEAGDDVQAMKAGIMEIADVFVVNKADRPGAETFIKNLQYIKGEKQIPIIKTVATENQGIEELSIALTNTTGTAANDERKKRLLIEKVYLLIQQKRMKPISRKKIEEFLVQKTGENIYTIAEELNATAY